MKNGEYFVTSGEVLISSYSVEGSGAQRAISADVEWTFPLEFVEIVWGDGKQTARQVISTTDLPPLGTHHFRIPFDTAGKKWIMHYERYVPAAVHILAIETPRDSIRGYDPKTYVEVDFFGEDDTRSNLVRLVSERFTKVINVPNMKDHSASGVTGNCRLIAVSRLSKPQPRGDDTCTEPPKALTARVSHRFGSPVTTRTYNPLVNRRRSCQKTTSALH